MAKKEYAVQDRLWGLLVPWPLGVFRYRLFSLDLSTDCTSMLSLPSRLRDDAALWYINREPHTGKAGRPKKYLGKVDIDCLDRKVFHEMDYDIDNGKCFGGQVYSKARKTGTTLFFDAIS